MNIGTLTKLTTIPELIQEVNSLGDGDIPKELRGRIGLTKYLLEHALGMEKGPDAHTTRAGISDLTQLLERIDSNSAK